MSQTSKIQTAGDVVLIDEDAAISLHEVCSIVNLQTEVVCQWVAEGVVTPSGRRISEWRFSQYQLQRIRQARRLQHDLNINTASLPLVLDLLDEISQLRRSLRRMENQFFE